MGSKAKKCSTELFKEKSKCKKYCFDNCKIWSLPFVEFVKHQPLELIIIDSNDIARYNVDFQLEIESIDGHFYHIDFFNIKNIDTFCQSIKYNNKMKYNISFTLKINNAKENRKRDNTDENTFEQLKYEIEDFIDHAFHVPLTYILLKNAKGEIYPIVNSDFMVLHIYAYGDYRDVGIPLILNIKLKYDPLLNRMQYIYSYEKPECDYKNIRIETYVMNEIEQLLESLYQDLHNAIDDSYLDFPEIINNPSDLIYGLSKLDVEPFIMTYPIKSLSDNFLLDGHPTEEDFNKLNLYFL